jgi:hypothetical protein
MLNLAETQAITKLFWQQWFPQMVYDVHQQGQNASRFIIPPFFDPVNPRIPPSILREVGLTGYKMAADLQAKNIAGVATNSTYDTCARRLSLGTVLSQLDRYLSEAASANLMSRGHDKERGLSAKPQYTRPHKSAGTRHKLP